MNADVAFMKLQNDGVGIFYGIVAAAALHGDAGQHYPRANGACCHLLHSGDEGTVHKSEQPAVAIECQRRCLAETIVALKIMGIQHASVENTVYQRDLMTANSHQTLVLQ